MTTAAWITMLITWSVIIYFTVKFFVMVLRKSGSGDTGSGDGGE